VSITAHSGVLRCICWCVTVRGSRYVVGHGVRVTVGGMAIGASWRVRHGMWVTARPTMCVLHYVACGVRALCVQGGGHNVGDTMRLVVSQSRCVDYATRETLRGRRCADDATWVMVC